MESESECSDRVTITRTDRSYTVTVVILPTAQQDTTTPNCLSTVGFVYFQDRRPTFLPVWRGLDRSAAEQRCR